MSHFDDELLTRVWLAEQEDLREQKEELQRLRRLTSRRNLWRTPYPNACALLQINVERCEMSIAVAVSA